MAATLIDPTAAPEHADELPPSEEMSQEALTEGLQNDTQAQPTDEFELPDKYKGKSIKDVIGMHQEAEKLIGKHSGEVGELRNVVDGFIKGKLHEADTPQPVEEPVDFFEDPDRAVSKAIESHPAVVSAQEQATQFKQQTTLAQLNQKHPDLGTVLQDPNFAQWVGSSNIRKELFKRADQEYDFDSADELVSTFKERAVVAQQAQQVEQVARRQQVKAASTGSGSGANTSGSKRVYRRADIIKLMKNDPARYEALSGEIMEAYRTGRVR